jgi:hypothetical protein
MTPTFSRIVAGTLVTLSLALTIPAHGSPVPVFDHLKCFQIKDDLGRRTILTADLTPQQNPPFANQNCKIKLPASHLCVDTSKSNVQNPDGTPFTPVEIETKPARDYLCYHMKCDKEAVVFDGTDQFGNRSVRSKKADYFCVPAEQVAAE